MRPFFGSKGIKEERTMKGMSERKEALANWGSRVLEWGRKGKRFASSSGTAFPS